MDGKYGMQFMAEKWEEMLLTTVYGMEKYPGSVLVKGVGPEFVKTFLEMTGPSEFLPMRLEM